MTQTKDLFISYTRNDRAWAEWIAWQLEEWGLSCELQAWDFVPGSNFVTKMQQAAKNCSRTLLILSPKYEQSPFTQAEWSAAFAGDPDGSKSKVVSVRVVDYRPSGLLGQIVYEDLVGLDETAAREKLRLLTTSGRAKPELAPPFPGVVGSKPVFPGAGTRSTPPHTRAPMPQVARRLSELDQRDLLAEVFNVTRSYFEAALKDLEERLGRRTLFEPVSEMTFEVSVEWEGRIEAECRISRERGDFGTGITYAEGRWSSNSVNDIISPNDNGTFRALMHMPGDHGALDPERLQSPEEVAEYLWRRFIWRIR